DATKQEPTGQPRPASRGRGDRGRGTGGQGPELHDQPGGRIKAVWEAVDQAERGRFPAADPVVTNRDAAEREGRNAGEQPANRVARVCPPDRHIHLRSWWRPSACVAKPYCIVGPYCIVALL